MEPTSSRTFVGIGFGPIQNALFLFEAFGSGNFARYVVAEIDPELVAAVRANGGAYTINIARPDRIDQVTVRGVELFNPQVSEDRSQLVTAIARADELATALPSVRFYETGDPSPARLLAEGLARRDTSRPAVIYTAENHNQAAEILTEALRRAVPSLDRDNLQVLNTVVGKMSGVIDEAAARDPSSPLQPLTPGCRRYVLVEEFNRILISRIRLPGFQRGIEVFIEKDDLLPFEEAKLYGHNAIHALLGYLADLRGLTTMAEVRHCPDLMQCGRTAFIEESGAALCRRYEKLGDPLFTPTGYRVYAEDLLERMTRPNLNDRVARVIRDQVRKLGYEDRLFGTMRLALDYGIRPTHLARGAAAAVLSMIRHKVSLPQGCSLPDSAATLTREHLGRFLNSLWSEKLDSKAGGLIELTWQALENITGRTLKSL